MSGPNIPERPACVDVEPHSSTPTEVTIILRGPSDLVGWAFGALMTFAPDLEKSCAVNNGWGVHNREKGATGYMRRTKSGLSINFYRDGDAKLSTTANTDETSDIHGIMAQRQEAAGRPRGHLMKRVGAV